MRYHCAFSKSINLSSQGGPIVMRPEDAVLIIKGWLDNQTDLTLSATTINFSVYSACRVVSIDGLKVTLGVEGGAVVAFSVDSPFLEIKYSELREFKGMPGMEDAPEEALQRSALSVTLSLNKIKSDAPLGSDVTQIFLLES